MKKLAIILLFVTVTATVNAQIAKAVPNPSAEKNNDDDDDDNLSKGYFSQIMGVALSATSNVKLFKFVYDWIGTPYHLGGDNKKGIDCSKFAFELYNKVFNTAIGNNSRNIFSMVNPVGKEELKEGDLVFFNIHSRSITHVGVYIGDGRFAHASSSKGVMISNLADPYWKRYYYNGGRLLAQLASNN